MVVTLAGVEAESAALAAAGTVVAGVGFGAAALGCFGAFALMAAPHERGELLAVAYVISYLAFSLPAVAAGFASTSYGLQADRGGLRRRRRRCSASRRSPRSGCSPPAAAAPSPPELRYPSTPSSPA